jgi:hypothetical protein
LIQPQHRSIGDHHVPESVNIDVNRVRDSDLVDTMLDEVTEVLRKCWRQSLIKSAGREGFIGSSVVTAPKAGECSALACGEAEHELPHESGHLCFPVAFAHAAFLGVLFEEIRWKKRSEPTHNPR